MYICIAGKNNCAIEILNYLKSKKKYRNKILALPNKSDNGINKWQKSFKSHAKKQCICFIIHLICYI